MLGRLTHETDPDYARRHFQKARAAVAEGYPDPLGLAAASYGWEARTYFLQQDYGTALDLYLQGNACGVEDIPSIAWSLSRSFGQSDETLAAYAGDPELRRLIGKTPLFSPSAASPPMNYSHWSISTTRRRFPRRPDHHSRSNRHPGAYATSSPDGSPGKTDSTRPSPSIRHPEPLRKGILIQPQPPYGCPNC